MAGKLGPRLPRPKFRAQHPNQTGGEPTTDIHVAGHGKVDAQKAQDQFHFLPEMMDLESYTHPYAAMHLFHKASQASGGSARSAIEPELLGGA